MPNINLDKNMLSYFDKVGIKKIKIFFYEAGCSGIKINISSDFEINNDLVLIGDVEKKFGNLQIYLENKDKHSFENCNITRVVKADHTGKEKVRYIFNSGMVKDRCGCGTSFSFEKKKLKLDLEKLKNLKKNFS